MSNNINNEELGENRNEQEIKAGNSSDISSENHQSAAPENKPVNETNPSVTNAAPAEQNHQAGPYAQNPSANQQTYTPSAQQTASGQQYSSGQYQSHAQNYANPGQNQYQNRGYSNGYAHNGYAQNAYGTHQYAPNNPTPAPQYTQVRKKRSGLSTGIAVVLCICTVLLSCASGFFGAYMATKGMNVTAAGDSSGKNVVVYTPSEDSETKNGLSSDDSTSRYYQVASKVKDSVVEITTEYTVSSFFQYVASGAGSGVIISQDGYIVTNNHVIADTENGNKLANTITVRLTNGNEYPATVIGTDSDSDIAVIKIEVTNLPYAVAGNSSKLAVGEEVIAVGNPLGELGGTVTNGIISAMNREVKVDDMTLNLLQTNAAINPGNSGGGLFNMDGQLIGIVNAKSSGTGIEGLGFAIPINEAMDVATQLIEKGYVSGRPYLGVTFYDVTSYQQALYLRVNALGVYVYSLEDGFENQALQVGDRVVAMDGTEVSSTSDIKAILKTHAVGDTITFSVYRNNKLTEVKVVCSEYTPDIAFQG